MFTRVIIHACYQSNTCHWLRPWKSWLYRLLLICNHAARYEVTPILTFDQTLLWKAFTIIHNEQQDSKPHTIILRLGGFHPWMSFLVSIDLIMKDSGIGCLWWKIYADSTLNHTVSGKAYTRATRGLLQTSVTSNTSWHLWCWLLQLPPFSQELNRQIYMMAWRQLHLTGEWQKCLSATMLKTSQHEDLECERDVSRLQLERTARFYNSLLTGKSLTMWSHQHQCKTYISDRTTTPPHCSPTPPHTPKPLAPNIIQNLEKFLRRHACCFSLW